VEPSEVLKEHGSSSFVPGVEVEVAIALDHRVPETPRPTTAAVVIKSSPEVEPNVITLDDILDAADRTVDSFEELAFNRVSKPKVKVPAKCVCGEQKTRKRKLPLFSDESSETEYSSSSESVNLSISNPTFLDTTDCATSGYISIYDVVLIHLSSYSDCSVDID